MDTIEDAVTYDYSNGFVEGIPKSPEIIIRVWGGIF